MEIYGPDLGMPRTRAMGDGLFELRIKSIEGIARVFYCTLVDRRIVFVPPASEALQIVTSATLARGADIKVPMLVRYGEWLKAVGFPIGSAAYLISDEQGEVVLHRVGLRLPRRLKVRAVPR